MTMVCPHCRKLMSEQPKCPYCGGVVNEAAVSMRERYAENEELQHAVKLALRYALVLSLVLAAAGISCSVLLNILVL